MKPTRLQMQLLNARSSRLRKCRVTGTLLSACIGTVLAVSGLAVYFGVLDLPVFRGVVSAVQSAWSADDEHGIGARAIGDGARTVRSSGGVGRRVALVIGNGAYEHVPALKNPRNDAEDMAAALRDVGFEVVAGTDLDRAAFYERIGEFTERARGAEAALFYYAGHGMQLSGANYLLPVDATQRSEWTLKGTAVKLQEVLANMGGAARLVFLDACRDNPFLEGIAGGGRSSAASRGLTRVASDSPGSDGGMFIAYATAPGAVAADGDGRNSPFTAALKRHIGEPGLEINEVINRVRRTVRAEQPSQTPWHSSSLQDAFHFAPRVDPAPAALGGAGLDGPDPEAEMWRQIRETTDAALLERFLANYPNGRYHGAAEARLAELRQRSFTVVVQPSGARVRILNIGPRYRAGMKLPAGEYRVEASAQGYETQTETVTHGHSATEHRITLSKAGPLAGEKFRDCPECPEMVVVPAGSYRMGSEDGYSDQRPAHEVTIGAPFAVGRYEVTFAEWDACVRDGACSRVVNDEGWGRGRRPVINVSWDDAQRYVQWLSRKTGRVYRLLSESEWEYAARAGTETAYSWGDEIGVNRANCRGCGSLWDGDKTAPVGSFGANAWGLHDMHGNVAEWVEDCWNDSYAGSPVDGSAQLTDCYGRVLRGGSWNVRPSFLRAADRSRDSTGYRSNNVLGFRVARTLAP